MKPAKGELAVANECNLRHKDDCHYELEALLLGLVPKELHAKKEPDRAADGCEQIENHLGNARAGAPRYSLVKSHKEKQRPIDSGEVRWREGKLCIHEEQPRDHGSEEHCSRSKERIGANRGGFVHGDGGRAGPFLFRFDFEAHGASRLKVLESTRDIILMEEDVASFLTSRSNKAKLSAGIELCNGAFHIGAVITRPLPLCNTRWRSRSADFRGSAVRLFQTGRRRWAKA